MNESRSAAAIEHAGTVSAHTDASPPRTVPVPVAWNDRRPESPPFFREQGPSRFLGESNESSTTYSNTRRSHNE